MDHHICCLRVVLELLALCVASGYSSPNVHELCVAEPDELHYLDVIVDFGETLHLDHGLDDLRGEKYVLD